MLFAGQSSSEEKTGLYVNLVMLITLLKHNIMGKEKFIPPRVHFEEHSELKAVTIHLANHLFTLWEDDRYNFSDRDNFINNLPEPPTGYKWSIIMDRIVTGKQMICQMDRNRF